MIVLLLAEKLAAKARHCIPLRLRGARPKALEPMRLYENMPCPHDCELEEWRRLANEPGAAAHGTEAIL